jgi:hypothetical protein
MIAVLKAALGKVLEVCTFSLANSGTFTMQASRQQPRQPGEATLTTPFLVFLACVGERISGMPATWKTSSNSTAFLACVDIAPLPLAQQSCFFGFVHAKYRRPKFAADPHWTISFALSLGALEKRFTPCSSPPRNKTTTSTSTPYSNPEGE